MAKAVGDGLARGLRRVVFHPLILRKTAPYFSRLLRLKRAVPYSSHSLFLVSL